MFSGIIEGIGDVVRVDRPSGGITLAIRVPEALRGLEPGASVAVNGTCLTVVSGDGEALVFDAVGATLSRTLLGKAEVGTRVNLERSLRMGDSLDGHFVTGHVDGVGTVVDRRKGDGAVFFTIEAPEELARQIAPRGSVAVDGVSLTVAEATENQFSVSIVPYTLEHTIMEAYKPGSPVHLETDVLAKYVQRSL